MKNIFTYFALCALLVGAGAGMGSCDPKETVTPATLDKPTEAKVIDVTATTATLTWNAVEGADNYEIRVGENTTSESTTNNSYNLTGLSPETEYTWQVRALKGDQVSDWVGGETFSTLPDEGGNEGGNDDEMSISVNFGNGEEVWTGAYGEALDWEDGEVSIYLWKYAEEGQDIPFVDAIINISGETVFPEAFDYSEYVYFDYFSEAYNDRITVLGEYTIGDWGVASGTANITSYENMLLSGTATLTMEDSYAYYMLGEDDLEQKSLVVTFKNVPVYFNEEAAAATSHETVRSALVDSDKTFSSKNNRTRIARRK